MYNVLEAMYKQAQMDAQIGTQQKVYPAKQQSIQPNPFTRKMNYTNKGKVKSNKVGELKLNSPYNEK